eukprot:4137990-Pyramimonas_sp.AAC.1
MENGASPVATVGFASEAWSGCALGSRPDFAPPYLSWHARVSALRVSALAALAVSSITGWKQHLELH